MFGIRPDGRKVRGGRVNPFVLITPYIMPTRNDAQVFTTQYLDADALSDYINEKRKQGIKMNHMAVIVAAWLRAVCELPMLNRFVIGKTIYARNELTVSFMTVRSRSRDEFEETAVKLWFDPTETIFQVAEKIDDAINKNREIGSENATDKLLKTILGMPALVAPVMGFLKLLDRLGLLPKAVLDAEPFHTSLFISNMASIKMNSIYHHIYNFGTTSIFFGVGRKSTRVSVDSDGKLRAHKVYPVGCVIDERIMAGAQYGTAFQIMSGYLRHPELLEQPPEKVLDEGVDFSLKDKYRNL